MTKLNAIVPLFIALFKLFIVTIISFIILFNLNHSFSLHFIVAFIIIKACMMIFKAFMRTIKAFMKIIKAFINFIVF